MILSMLKRQLKLGVFKKAWRRENKRNDSYVVNLFPKELVTVGVGTYGPLSVKIWEFENAHVVIGNYVSIAEGVKFLAGGNHNYRNVSTFPYDYYYLNPGKITNTSSKGDIVVKDDAWIGTDAFILSGVTIGQGAVVAARSVVTKDVPAYAIVGGNPAKVLKMRFSQAVIDKLLHLDFSKIQRLDNPEKDQVMKLLTETPTEEGLINLSKRISNAPKGDGE